MGLNKENLNNCCLFIICLAFVLFIIFLLSFFYNGTQKHIVQSQDITLLHRELQLSAEFAHRMMLNAQSLIVFLSRMGQCNRDQQWSNSVQIFSLNDPLVALLSNGAEKNVMLDIQPELK